MLRSYRLASRSFRAATLAPALRWATIKPQYAQFKNKKIAEWLAFDDSRKQQFDNKMEKYVEAEWAKTSADSVQQQQTPGQPIDDRQAKQHIPGQPKPAEKNLSVSEENMVAMQ